MSSVSSVFTLRITKRKSEPLNTQMMHLNNQKKNKINEVWNIGHFMHSSVTGSIMCYSVNFVIYLFI